MPAPAGLWRRAGEPVAAHEIAQALLDGDAYARTRGVAQQAARLARTARLPRDARARLLAAAWLHDLSPAGAPRQGARALRRAGHEPLARLVAHRRFAAMEAAIRGLPPLAAEFPVPRGADEGLLMLLDIAQVTTDGAGAPCTPATALRGLVERVGPRDPAVRALVALVSRLGEDPTARALVEMLAPRPAVR
ncbi:MAG TPA: hypothetical protein VNT51_01995 [Miltoncostaeaceae bacterium]|jgi:hypothetical protein|nr:hypothetical protein [Miltoncostaeaceae bacterium]